MEIVNCYPVGCGVGPLHADGHILGGGVFEAYGEVLGLLVCGGNGSGAVAHEEGNTFHFHRFVWFPSGDDICLQAIGAGRKRCCNNLSRDSFEQNLQGW